MKILSIKVGHDASVCILNDGKIIYYQMSERISRRKHDGTIDDALTSIYNLGHSYFDLILITYLPLSRKNYVYDYLVKFIKLEKGFKYGQFIVDDYNHHKYHAYCGFYNSNFKEALCFSLDGAGSIHKELFAQEIESIFILNKNDPNNEIEVFKHYHSFDKNYLPSTEKNKISDESSVGWQYEDIAEEFGFKWYDAGKVMGISQYKNNLHKLPSGYNNDVWIDRVDKAHNVQIKTQNHVINLIKKYTKETGINNVVISGGYGLNCVSNYEYLLRLNGINLYVDPICFDAGISIGSAYCYCSSKNNIKPISNVYIGYEEKEYDLSTLNHKKVKYSDIVDLILHKNVVAIFQGKAEAGQRALGNRSLLFDPRVKNGKDIVNRIKRRENYRPFAGTVLLEYAKEWFDMRGLSESPYMLYATKVHEEKISKIPAVVHADDTCRIQTVTKEQNYHFYNLIRKFYKKTNIPILLNTSFNLAGEPLVDSFEHALSTLKKSKIEYLYLPDIETLVTIKNNA